MFLFVARKCSPDFLVMIIQFTIFLFFSAGGKKYFIVGRKMVLARNTPDSGWSWIVLIVTFLLQMITASFTYSVGILKLAFLDKYGEDPIKTDWVGSFHVAISQMSGKLGL